MTDGGADRADRAVARGLASACLGAADDPWDVDALAARLREALSGRAHGAAGGTTRGPRWAGTLARTVLTAYAHAPRDRPRELATFVAAAPAFRRAAERGRSSGRPVRVVAVPAAPTAMAHPRWPVAPLDDVAALAALVGTDVEHLLWFADPQGRQRRGPRGSPLHLYRYRWLARPGRVPRLLEVPRPRLVTAQRRVLDAVVGRVPAHPAAHGFVPGRSALTHAAAHAGAAVVVTLDLTAFFASVRAARAYGVLRTAGYPEPVAHLLTALCTSATPVGVLTDMPPGGSPEQRHALRAALRTPHLPQGAPTSPHLANLAAYGLDVRLAGYARAAGATYTRYADDLAFSGGARMRRRADALVAGVGAIVADEGYRLNRAKTRVQGDAGRQLVTGLVVNDRPRVPRREVDTLRAVLHNAARTGPAAQNHLGHPDFRAHLQGRVAWVAALDPVRGARLRADLDRIDWSNRSNQSGAPGGTGRGGQSSK